MATTDYYLNDAKVPVRAASPAAAVAKDLRAAGYAARAKGRLHVFVPQDVAEMLGGVTLVRARSLRAPVEVTLGGRYKAPVRRRPSATRRAR